MTTEGDLVLVYMDGHPAFFARIEAITADYKPGWFHVKMLVLQVPVMLITWILRDTYINGGEFTMGGRPIRLEKVVAPEEEEEGEVAPKKAPPSEPEAAKKEPEKEKPSEPAPEKGKVVSLLDRKKKDH